MEPGQNLMKKNPMKRRIKMDNVDEPKYGYKAHLVAKRLKPIEKDLGIKFTTARYESVGPVKNKKVD